MVAPSIVALSLLAAMVSSASAFALLTRMGARIGAVGVLPWQGGKVRDSIAHQASYAPVSVSFHLGNTTVHALSRVGEKISDLAAKANVAIRYKCRKGECGTCQVKLQGQWVKACQGHVPAPYSKECNVTIVVPEEESGVPSSRLFSPGVILEGMVNNAVGMARFVAGSFAAGREYSQRIQREKDLQARAQARRQSEAVRNSTG